MSKQVIETMTFTFETNIECSNIGQVGDGPESMFISGILLKEGVSRNGNLYTVQELRNIAAQARDLPIYVGVMRKLDPNSGTYRSGMHANLEKNRVGEIRQAYFDELRRLVRFEGFIQNTKTHPKIVQKVKRGWGISIGGIAHKTQIVINEAKRALFKIKDMVLSHIQLLQPWVKCGVEGAEIDYVEIQESMTFQPRKLDQRRIKSIVKALIKSGDINV